MIGSRPHFSDARGFTLIELLVVILIIAILAAIAVPAYLNQRERAQDTEAKTTLKTAYTALVTYHVNEQTYAATPAELLDVEPALTNARALTTTGDAFGFEASEESGSGTVFTMRLLADGRTERVCDRPGEGLCRSTADASGNRW